MTHKEIRSTFIDFFVQRDHKEIPNSSLVPEHDPTLLFTNSGMAPLKNYFIGAQTPPHERMVNVQRCIRTEDLENVGYTAGHLTFFEMMGSWSVGGYGKHEAAHFAYDLLVNGFGLDPERMYATVFAGDDTVPEDAEAKEAWIHAGLPEERILALPASENFWCSGPVGPCGPCTEVLYDLGEEYASVEDSTPLTDDNRFMEIWNAGVFMQYDRQDDGSLSPLPIRSVDTGAGVERFAMVLQGKESVYETDLFYPIIQGLEEISSQQFDNNVSFKIIADHLRSVTFAIADGALPSNTGRGYVVRRLLRRAVMHAQKLDMNGYVLSQLAGIVIDTMDDVYPHLLQERQQILAVVQEEEELFSSTLRKGTRKLEKILSSLTGTTLSGDDAFSLYDSHGFPIELTQEMAGERGITVDTKSFEQNLLEQQERSRKAGAHKKKAMAALGDEVSKNHTAAHLLNEALRRVIDPSIRQAGQDLNAERLRFDFTFDRALTPEELAKVEKEVQDQINADLPVTITETTFEEAQQAGVQALFADKYQAVDQVTLYSIGDYAKELCGGPHVSRTGEISSFKIVKQKSVGRGVRRIRAVAK